MFFEDRRETYALSGETIVKYDLFISYYSGTGGDFAKFLKTKLRDFGVNAFLDTEDIPKTVKDDTDEWRNWVDKAIANSKRFVLLMTWGFNTRPEILRELKVAQENSIERIHLKHVGIDNTNLIMKIGDETLDLSKFQYVEFSDEPDLLRKLGAELFGLESKHRETSVFMETVLKLMNSEGFDARSVDSPIIEVIVGSSDEAVEWFPISPENRDLIWKSPYGCANVTTSRTFFDCDCRSTGEFFRVHTKGFFHLITPIPYDKERNECYIDSIIGRILEIFKFSVKAMKLRNVNANQSMYIILRNISNVEMTFDRYSIHRGYKFPKGYENVEFKDYQFNPAVAWSETRKLFSKIYRDLCTELSIIEITDTTINKRLYNIVMGFRKGIEMREFGFTEEDKK